MRFLAILLSSFLLTACMSSAPNPVVQELDLAIIKMAAVMSRSVAIESAYKREDIIKIPEVNDQKTTFMISANHVEPFHGCARYNTAYRYKKTGLFGSERNYDFIFEICEKDQDLYNVKLIYPDVPGFTGVEDIVDVRRTALYLEKK